VRVSVIVPTYNHAAFLAQAIRSALEQTVPPWEIVVVDDGSTDATGDVLRSFGSGIKALRQANRGVARARNAGAALATGQLLAFLDADDAWLPPKLERQIAVLQANPELGLVHCGVEEIDALGRSLRIRLDGLSGSVSTEMLLFRRGVILGGGSAAMIPKTVFDAAEGFDPSLSTSADWDLHFRIARRHSVGFVPAPLVRYRIHGGSMHSNVRAMEADMLRAYAKAFAEKSPDLEGIRRQAYSRLHAVLAGSFFGVAQYRSCLRHTARSLLLSPGNLERFAGLPWRRLRRVFQRAR
jgi:glycosyltransferase involved in cell wall biosynthesis